MYGVVPPLAVNGVKLVIAVPTVKLCAVVIAVALIEAPPNPPLFPPGCVVVVVPPPPLRHAASKSADNGSALRINPMMFIRCPPASKWFIFLFAVCATSWPDSK